MSANVVNLKVYKFCVYTCIVNKTTTKEIISTVYKKGSIVAYHIFSVMYCEPSHLHVWYSKWPTMPFVLHQNLQNLSHILNWPLWRPCSNSWSFSVNVNRVPVCHEYIFFSYYLEWSCFKVPDCIQPFIFVLAPYINKCCTLCIVNIFVSKKRSILSNSLQQQMLLLI